jgi:hypothetical protein
MDIKFVVNQKFHSSSWSCLLFQATSHLHVRNVSIDLSHAKTSSDIVRGITITSPSSVIVVTLWQVVAHSCGPISINTRRQSRRPICVQYARTFIPGERNILDLCKLENAVPLTQFLWWVIILQHHHSPAWFTESSLSPNF